MRCLTILWVLLLGLQAGAADALPAATWLVSIGNNAGEPDEVSLLYAERDARQMLEIMQRNGGVHGNRARLLANGSADSVREALSAAEAQIAALGADVESALIVYYSGHADARALHLGNSHLRIDELRQRIAASKAKVRVLIVDACRSGAVTRVKGVSAGTAFAVNLHGEMATEGTAIITSSTEGETSQESDRLRGSFFSHHFFNALRGASDRNNDGQITLSEAYNYAYDQTVRSSGRTLSVQHPTFAWDMKGRGELTLTKVAPKRGGAAGLRLGPAVDYLVSEVSSGAIVAELRPRTDGATLALPPRRYVVQRRGLQEYREYVVALSAGQTVDLATVPFKSTRYDRLVRQRGSTDGLVHGIRMLGGSQGELLEGDGLVPHLVLGYGVDLPWFSIGVRFRASQNTVRATFDRQTSTYGGGLTLERYIDFEWCSLAVGLLGELTHYQQTFNTTRVATDTRAWGAAFGGLLAVERPLFAGVSLRLEGGPTTVVVPRTEVDAVGTVAQGPIATFTWRAAVGLNWRL